MTMSGFDTLRADITGLRTDLRAQIAALRTDIEASLATFTGMFAVVAGTIIVLETTGFIP